MYPEDDFLNPNEYDFLDDWEKSIERQAYPNPVNPGDPLDDMLDHVEHHIEGHSPIDPDPIASPSPFMPDEGGAPEQDLPQQEEDDIDQIDTPFLPPQGKGGVNIGPSWDSNKNSPPLHGDHFSGGRGYHPPKYSQSRSRGSAGLGHGSGRSIIWCPISHTMVNIEDCQDCEYFNEQADDTDDRCEHPDKA